MTPPAAPIRALVVDDERLARKSLQVLLSADAEVELVGECGRPQEAVRLLKQRPVDLLFLDVQMPGMDGFELLEAAGTQAAVVFVTAFEQHALRAFEVRAVDYLLKPYDDERFATVLARAKAHVRGQRLQALAQQLAGMVASPAAPPAPSAPRHLERLVVRESGRVTLLPVEQVDWVEADDYYVQVHAGGKSHLLRQSLRELETQLDPQRFLRIHRSTLVNVARVKSLEPLFHGEYWVVLQDGHKLKLSRSFRDRLDALLSGR
ncbi:response regulator transcription factor [Aggregicoccus sp. 17bor-14]|uniref:LytR/AlgR family response regulator transcription factor n=1 Tax=Myxococcaceae TaxID=31 RepID=UPI00129D0438|nr:MULTISPECIES: LytTR family DNA-binding domain-containing protein [Myxococcaceae]MBF5042186.1 response regulator transcription factor [Simulacricoccus sp. 17bor-14]MRI87963.1 response regulator transcription factor [Aggregicoccus sp. 17bor-14]